MRKEQLTELFKKYGVKVAYLFGSQKEKGIAFLAEEEPKADRGSDLDIGVVFNKLPSNSIELYSQMYVSLNTFFGPFEVDIVFLQETNIFLQYEAIKGEIVYCADRVFVEEYEEKVMKIAADLNYKKKSFERDFFEAVKNGYFRIEC
jgi:uncharacterized protein